ncbi:MAG: zinc ribbon domain-containing protein [Coriobacteriia bacterium]|nr:zinc ribbon domain-containing protein [Coriobacteriia bacterium]
MLNCKNCGAPLSPDEAVCAYCGTPNPQVQESLKKQKALDKAVDSTRQQVVDEVKQAKRGYSLLVVLAVLLLANLVLLPMHEASYEIADTITEGDMTQNQITATLDQLLDEGEYIEMGVFADKHHLSYSDNREYMMIASLAADYNDVIEYTTRYFHGTDDYDDPLVRACQRIKGFKENYANITSRDISPDKLVHVERINAELESYVRDNLHLTDEDLADISTMSDTRLLVLVDERLHDED